MDKSTDNVTIVAGVITDVLKNYQDKKQEYKALFDIANGCDFSKPTNRVPIQIYFQMCDWIEQNLGKFNLMRIGRNVGESTYDTMISNKMVSGKCSPVDVMKALVITSQIGVQDPKKRGWEIISYTEKSVLMRKTQNFNCVLQIGLLEGLVRKSGVMGVKVELVNEVNKGAEYDEYMITWF